jgi:hypothetical protein
MRIAPAEYNSAIPVRGNGVVGEDGGWTDIWWLQKEGRIATGGVGRTAEGWKAIAPAE